MQYLTPYKSYFLTEETQIIKLNEWIEQIRLKNSFIENLTLTYEYEYKFSKILSTPMINEKRKENILSAIEDKMNPILSKVVDDMISVYDSWIKSHHMFDDMKDIKEWLKESYQDVWNDIDEFRSLLESEYVSYSKQFTKGFKPAIYDLLHLIDDKKSLLEFARVYIYPMWFNIWKRSAMKSTLVRIRKVRDDLNRISDSMSFRQKQAEINIALNTMHQTGSMSEHIAMYLDCDEEDLNRLSTLPASVIKKWDKDLIEMGIY